MHPAYITPWWVFFLVSAAWWPYAPWLWFDSWLPVHPNLTVSTYSSGRLAAVPLGYNVQRYFVEYGMEYQFSYYRSKPQFFGPISNPNVPRKIWLSSLLKVRFLTSQSYQVKLPESGEPKHFAGPDCLLSSCLYASRHTAIWEERVFSGHSWAGETVHLRSTWSSKAAWLSNLYIITEGCSCLTQSMATLCYISQEDQRLGNCSSSPGIFVATILLFKKKLWQKPCGWDPYMLALPLSCR